MGIQNSLIFFCLVLNMWVQKRRRQLKGLKIGQNLSTAMSKKLPREGVYKIQKKMLTSFMDGSYLEILYLTEFFYETLSIGTEKKTPVFILLFILHFQFNGEKNYFFVLIRWNIVLLLFTSTVQINT